MSERIIQADLRSARKPFRFKSDWGWAYLLIAPTIIGLLILNIYPFFETIILSLQKSQGLGPVKFVGLKNYQNCSLISKFGIHCQHAFLLYAADCAGGRF